jgi:hypothetical protein
VGSSRLRGPGGVPAARLIRISVRRCHMSNLPSQEREIPANRSSWLRTGLIGTATLGLNLFYSYVMPSFHAMFNDLGQQMPKITKAIVLTPPVTWMAIGVSLSAAILLKNLLFRERVCFLIDVAAAVGCCISLIVIVMALFLPLSGGTIKNIK